jgi:hypothetical protein
MARTATLQQMSLIASNDTVQTRGLLAVVALLADVLNDSNAPLEVREFVKASVLNPEKYITPLARAIAVDEIVQSKVIVNGEVDLRQLSDEDISRIALRCFQILAPSPVTTR